MTAWLRRGAAAAATVSERSDLWPAGALAALAYLGWLPLLLAIAPPTPGDVADLAVTLYSSGSFPANVIALTVAAPRLAQRPVRLVAVDQPVLRVPDGEAIHAVDVIDDETPPTPGL